MIDASALPIAFGSTNTERLSGNTSCPRPIPSNERLGGCCPSPLTEIRFHPPPALYQADLAKREIPHLVPWTHPYTDTTLQVWDFILSSY